MARVDCTTTTKIATQLISDVVEDESDEGRLEMSRRLMVETTGTTASDVDPTPVTPTAESLPVAPRPAATYLCSSSNLLEVY